MILLLHKMLISNIHDDIAGRFRKTMNMRVGNHIARPKEILPRLEKMFGNTMPQAMKT